jgi:uncharacterized protein (TIGR02391 family)
MKIRVQCWCFAMRTLTDAFPDAKTMLAISPEELGDVILELVQADGPGPVMFSQAHIMDAVNNRFDPPWSEAIRPQVVRAVAESFCWLENAGLIMPDPGQGNGTSYRCLTRRGHKLHTRKLAEEYRSAGILPVALVHPAILEKSHAAFMRGDHDIAVLAAFKAVEVAVREACGFQNGEIGIPLMRRAFNRDNGPLTDPAQEAGERQALQDLFAGAIGAAKNPASHRDVEMSKTEAARLILFASYLMAIVDGRLTSE